MQKNNSQKGVVEISTIAAVVIVAAFAAAVSIYATSKYYEELTTATPTTIATPKTTPSATPTPDATANWQTYTNNKYGFELRFPLSWDGYKTKDVKVTWGDNNQYKFDGIAFGFKEQDDLFRIGFMTADQWNKIDSADGPSPVYINKNDKFVFAYISSQEAVNDELAKKMNDLDQIISTFKFTGTDETADWQAFSSSALGISFKYPTNYIIMDRLNGEEKAILLGDKEFPKPDIAPWYHAPITISHYEATKVNDQISALSNVKNNIITIDNQSANLTEGNYPDYPAPEAVASNHIKIITISNKNLAITAQDSYAGTKSNWNNISFVLDQILSTFKFTK